MRDATLLSTLTAALGACLLAGGLLLAIQAQAFPGLALALLGTVLLVFTPALQATNS